MSTLIEQFQAMLNEALGKGATPPAPPPVTPPAATPDPAAPVNLSNVVNPSLQSVYQDTDQVDQLDANVQEVIRQRVNVEMRKKHTQDFAAELIGGTKLKPYGFAVKSKDLIAWMLSLTDAQAKFAEKLLLEMKSKAIDFAEHGFDNSEGFMQLPPLDEKIAGFAREWMKIEGNTIEGFFKANPELGGIDKFNVKEFMKAKE